MELTFRKNREVAEKIKKLKATAAATVEGKEPAAATVEEKEPAPAVNGASAGDEQMDTSS